MPRNIDSETTHQTGHNLVSCPMATLGNYDFGTVHKASKSSNVGPKQLTHTITNHIQFHPLSKLTITLQGSYQLINLARSKPNAMLANYATWNGNKHIRTCLPNHESKISYWHAVLTPATKNRSETQHFLHELRPASNPSPQKNTTEKVHVW